MKHTKRCKNAQKVKGNRAVLTTYYKMVKCNEENNISRYDCVASTGEYKPFERIAQKASDERLHIYTGNTEHIKEQVQFEDKQATTNTEYISSVFYPDMEQAQKGVGNTKGTNDCLLFLFNKNYNKMEVFVARGQKNNQNALFTQFINGELDEEMERLRKSATHKKGGAL